MTDNKDKNNQTKNYSVQGHLANNFVTNGGSVNLELLVDPNDDYEFNFSSNEEFQGTVTKKQARLYQLYDSTATTQATENRNSQDINKKSYRPDSETNPNNEDEQGNGKGMAVVNQARLYQFYDLTTAAEATEKETLNISTKRAADPIRRRTRPAILIELTKLIIALMSFLQVAETP